MDVFKHVQRGIFSFEHHQILQLIVSLFLALSFKAGKDNITTTAPGLFACKKISFQYPFSGGQQVKVFASVGHAVRSPTHRYGAAIWVESVSSSGFTVCVLEFGDGSNGTASVNWVALQSTPARSQLGTASLKTWTTGTKCQTIDFRKVRFTLNFSLPQPPSFFQPFTPSFLFLSLFQFSTVFLYCPFLHFFTFPRLLH